MMQLLHTDAAQGSNEERNKTYNIVRRTSTAIADTVMRCKHGGVAKSSSQAGHAVQEVAIVC